MTPPATPSRRDFVTAAATATCLHLLHCKPRDTAGWHDLPFPDAPAGATWASLFTPAVPDPPLLIALHGRGEAGRGAQTGAQGWRDDYHLDQTLQRLQQPPLTTNDFHHFVKPQRLQQLNASLAAHPYRGLAIACPYTPALSDRSLPGAQPFADFIRRQLIPACQQRLGHHSDAPRIGIDGVSMGGRLALFVGLSHPQWFQSLGALQPAIAVSEAALLTQLALKAQRQQPLPPIRLLSSQDDPFLPAVQALSHAFRKAGILHHMHVTPGPHDYAWNQGPGGYEMLLWHERILRRLPTP